MSNQNNMLSDYSSMEQEIRSAPETKVLPKKSEVHARIVNFASGISEKGDFDGARWFRFTLDVPDDPLVKEFGIFLWDPLTFEKISNPKAVARGRSDFNKFTACFGFDLSKPIRWEDDSVGKMGWVVLGQTEDDYGLKNTVTSFSTGPGKASIPAEISDSDIPF